MLLFLILTYACGGKSEGREKVQRQKNQLQNMEEDLKDSLLSEPIVNESDSNVRYILEDSLSANKVWIYQYTDGIFPCDSDGGCVIRGFWTDGKGRFYIVGGIPLRLACYKGNKQEYSRVISNAICNSCMLRMRGDSLWFVEDSEQTILRIHKSGRGEIVRHSIPLTKEDSIMGGSLYEDSYVLTIKDRSGGEEAYKYETHDLWERTSEFAYPVTLLRTAKTKEQRNNLYAPYNAVEWDGFPFNPYYYMGNIDEWMVYLTYREYDRGYVGLRRKGENAVYIFPLQGLPPVAAIGITDDMWGWMHSDNLDQFINGTLYLSGYGPDNGLFEIHAFDIEALCRRLERSK